MLLFQPVQWLHYASWVVTHIIWADYSTELPGASYTIASYYSDLYSWHVWQLFQLHSWYTRCTYSQCMPCMHAMTFKLTGDTCALLLVGVKHASGTVSHVQHWQSICWKNSRKWVRFWTPHQTQRYGHFSRRPFFGSLAAALSYSSISPQTSRGSGSLLTSVFASVSYVALPRSHHIFLPFWCCDNETTSTATALGTVNLCKCTQHFVKMIF